MRLENAARLAKLPTSQPTALSDADIERIAQRVVELLIPHLKAAPAPKSTKKDTE